LVFSYGPFPTRRKWRPLANHIIYSDCRPRRLMSTSQSAHLVQFVVVVVMDTHYTACQRRSTGLNFFYKMAKLHLICCGAVV